MNNKQQGVRNESFYTVNKFSFSSHFIASNVFHVSTETVATSPFNGEWPLRGHAPSILTSLAAVAFSSPFLMRMSLAPFCTNHVRTTFRCLFALPSDHVKIVSCYWPRHIHKYSNTFNFTVTKTT